MMHTKLKASNRDTNRSVDFVNRPLYAAVRHDHNSRYFLWHFISDDAFLTHFSRGLKIVDMRLFRFERLPDLLTSSFQLQPWTVL